MSNFDLILPHLGQELAELILDRSISEIMVNSNGKAFIERAGVMVLVDGVVIDEYKRQAAIRSIARVLGQDVSEDRPLLDSRLEDGSRIAAAIPPASVGGSVLTIRKFPALHFTVDDLVERQMLTESQADVLRVAVQARKNILISGGTSAGKTSVLNALTQLIPKDQRIVVIEDTAEIFIDAPNVVRFEARRALNGTPAITIGELLRATLRHRPDRILVGEVRGPEAWDLLQALTSGHSGSVSTIHANSARLAGVRLLHCVQSAGQNIPAEAICASIADAVNLLVHIERTAAGHRYIKEILRVLGYDSATNTYKLEGA
jgi:pilus assembly protein CpaF